MVMQNQKSIKYKELLQLFRKLEEEERILLFQFANFLMLQKKKKSASIRVNWEDIEGITEFESDSSINHDSYIGKTI